MVKISKLGFDHAECIQLLDKMFRAQGIRPKDPDKKMSYWVVSDDQEQSLLDESILSVDESGNELRAVYFVTRRKTGKKLRIFRFTELYPELHRTEKDVRINEAIERFMEEKTDHIRPVAVVLLGKMEENGQLYAGGFVYKVPIPDSENCIEATYPELCVEEDEE